MDRRRALLQVLLIAHMCRRCELNYVAAAAAESNSFAAFITQISMDGDFLASFLHSYMITLYNKAHVPI